MAGSSAAQRSEEHAGNEARALVVLEHGAELATVRAERNPVAVYLATLTTAASRRSANTAIKMIAAALGCDAEVIPWTAIDYEHATAIRARLIELGRAPASVNLALSILRGIARTAARLRLISAEQAARVVDVPGVTNDRPPAGRAVGFGELARLFAAAEGGACVRDRAMLAVLFGAGLRRSEIVGLDVASLDMDSGVLRVHGKGRKVRDVHLTPDALPALRAWLDQRGDHPGPLFVQVLKGGRITARRLSPDAVLKLLRRLTTRAGLRPASPHDGRRSYISALLDAGADLAAVQRLAGHAQITTTARYDRRPEEAKRRAAALLRLPISS